jgi:ferredoxin
MVDRAEARILERAGLARLLEGLRADHYRLIGPTVRDGAIVYDAIESLDDLPAGWTDEQGPGRYHLSQRGDGTLFGYTVGPQSWKRLLFPPRIRIFSARRNGRSLAFSEEQDEPQRYAFIGVRACELRAIAIQDRIFLEGPHDDPFYRRRREGAFILAVNCTRAGGTCFCASMGTGPRVGPGFDLTITELVRDERHDFLVEVGSERGAEALAGIPGRPSEAADREAAEEQMGRSLDTDALPELLESAAESPRWDDVERRCLACTNCTLVCPTCFCSSVEDVSDLGGERAERWRRWDSCFTLDFSYIHGGAVRPSIRSRYRQWLTHKLGTWHAQFGSSGCVGCGRCITWCPVGIDLTEEVKALRAAHGAEAERRE